MYVIAAACLCSFCILCFRLSCSWTILGSDHIASENKHSLKRKHSKRLIRRDGHFPVHGLAFGCSDVGTGSVVFLAATKQLYEWYFPSVRLSVCPSVCLSVTPFWLCSHHRIIMIFPGVITQDQGKVHAKGQGQRSKVKVTEVTTQLNRFRTVTPVWIHIWWWNDTYSLMLLRRGALLFLKVIRQISRSQGAKNRRVWPRLGVSGL